MNKNKKIPFLSKLFKHSDFCTKITLFFSTKQAGEFYDSYEENYTYTNLNPLTIKGYVSQLSASSLVWGQYGLREQGAVEVLCDSKYKNMFEKCNKIVINNEEYEVFREATGGKTLITERTKKMLRIVLTRTGKS